MNKHRKNHLSRLPRVCSTSTHPVNRGKIPEKLKFYTLSFPVNNFHNRPHVDFLRNIAHNFEMMS